jgi:hypothetical protein
MKLGHYILDAEHRPVPVPLMQWAEWFEDITNRLVDYTEITSETHVSTVFLGLDHRFSGNGPPILFETMIFGGPLDQEQWRYASWDDAEAGHKAAVRKARAAIGQKV